MTHAAAPAHPDHRRVVDLGVCVGLVLVTLALYAPVRTHAFLNYDDNEYVTENPAVRAGLTRASVRWALTGVHQATWHPLTSLSHLVDVELFGLDAGAHLAVNVVLHALSTMVLFLVLRTLTGARWPSAWVAAVFAWHPLHVESVAWVAERKDVLSGLFWMLTLAAYVGYVRRPGWLRYLVVLVVFALGLLAKPMLVTLPAVLLLLDHWPLGRLRPDGATAGARRATPARLVLEKLPLLALAGLVAAVTVVAQEGAGALGTLASAPLSYRVGNALVAYATYLRKMVWPNDLAVFYPAPRTLSLWVVLGATALLTAITAFVARHARRHPALPVGWLWYLGTLVPVIGLVRQGDQAMADRFTYLPSIGIFLMLAWGLAALATGDSRRRRALAGAAVLVLAACVVLSARQLRHWETSVTLFRHALAVTDDNYLADGNLGVALDALGRHDEAMTHFERAVAIAPDYAKARLNLGHALARAGRSAAAAAELAAAVRLDPRSAPAEYDWGLLLAERGALDAAIGHYRRAVALDPGYAKAYNNLGWAFAAQGKLAEAVPAYERALAIAPDLTAAHNNLAVALEGLGRSDEALVHYAAAVRLAPDEPRAHANYAAVLAERGRRDEAIAEYRAAMRLAPDLLEVQAALAAAYADAGRIPEAIATADAALAAARAAGRDDLADSLAQQLAQYNQFRPRALGR